jgi:hypothetical protein
MKIAIVGTCPSSRMLAPYNDESWEIWTCSPDNVDRLPRVSRWFELHGDVGWEDQQQWEVNFLAWLNAQSFPLYVQVKHMFRDSAIRFPYEELTKEFGTYWFTSMFAWMMAFAIHEGATEIGIFGADMAADSEYGYQKPAMRRFIEYAEERQIKVSAPMESDILQPPPLYGYSVSTPMGRKLRVREKEILKRVRELRIQRENMVRQLDHDIDHLVGALDQLNYAISTWTGMPDVGKGS